MAAMEAGTNPQAVKAAPGGFILWGGGGKNGALGGRAPFGDGERAGRQGRSRLVPRRLVRSLDHGLERRRRRGLLRSPAGHRRRSLARRDPLRAADVAPGESKTVVLRLAWYAGQTNLRDRQDAAAQARRAWPSKARTGPGMPAASPASTK